MEKGIFREKSLEKIQSPESLNDYIRVSNPGVWMIVAAAIILLVGACIWGIFGHVDTTVKTEATVVNGTAVCMVESAELKEGMPITINGKQFTIEQADMQQGICFITVQTQFPDGTYPAEVKTESVSPFSLVFQ